MPLSQRETAAHTLSLLFQVKRRTAGVCVCVCKVRRNWLINCQKLHTVMAEINNRFVKKVVELDMQVNGIVNFAVTAQENKI